MINIIENKIDDKIPVSNKVINDCGFDKIKLKRRTQEINELQKLYPNMAYNLLETAWNWCEKLTLEEQNQIIASGVMNLPSSRDGSGGIILNSVHIEKSQSTIEYENSILDV